MDSLVREFAGAEREFRLRFGDILDVEAARNVGIGEIFLRLSTGRYYAGDVFEVIRQGLVGGGLKEVAARALVRDRMEIIPFSEAVDLALDIVLTAMNGVEKSDEDAPRGDPSERYEFSTIGQLSRVFNMSPNDVREMRYSDLVNLLKGFRAAGKDAPHITEDEFEDILRKYEPEALNG